MVRTERLELSRTRHELLRLAWLPITSRPHSYNLVLPRGIEPRSKVLQTSAMTTSAKAAGIYAMVPSKGNDPLSNDYQSFALPLS